MTMPIHSFTYLSRITLSHLPLSPSPYLPLLLHFSFFTFLFSLFIFHFSFFILHFSLLPSQPSSLPHPAPAKATTRTPHPLTAASALL